MLYSSFGQVLPSGMLTSVLDAQVILNVGSRVAAAHCITINWSVHPRSCCCESRGNLTNDSARLDGRFDGVDEVRSWDEITAADDFPASSRSAWGKKALSD